VLQVGEDEANGHKSTLGSTTRPVGGGVHSSATEAWCVLLQSMCICVWGDWGGGGGRVVYVYVCACKCANVHVYVSVCIHVCVCACVFVSVYMYMCMCVCTRWHLRGAYQ